MMPSRHLFPALRLRGIAPMPQRGWGLRRAAGIGGFGLALALALLPGTVAHGQALQPPGDLMRPQGQAQKPATPAAPFTAPLPPHRPAQAAGAGSADGITLAQAKPTGQAKPGSAAPDGRAARSTIDRVTNYYNSVQALSGNFTQIDPDGSRRTGDFYMQKPGRVRFEYDPPSPVELISNGQSVAVRDRKLNTQDITPLSQTPLRFLLAEQIDLATDPHVTGVFQDDNFVSVVMQEQVPMIGTYRLIILFDTKTSALKQWIVTDPQGYDTQVTLTNAQVNKRPDPKLFVINFERMLQ
ncbi:outer-membrane lipoprotein carrier protein LolA [Xanthobacter dioxanivorans]|uniref:Outer-membrane lipoprotein carrier protein LolA n=1 Tax=Xanthobacter dioxanivorans TaxID=2528964 RepID=A0A974PR16_9HYPH|nr:outer-membrane lipoprotein carrier protein LolA [Xanthobacter dioxanivorans]QRG08202.1 outer-membrane lipoprotein carrier protein LolA [Xanthobacter dioxanivorans]